MLSTVRFNVLPVSAADPEIRTRIRRNTDKIVNYDWRIMNCEHPVYMRPYECEKFFFPIRVRPYPCPKKLL